MHYSILLVEDELMIAGSIEMALERTNKFTCVGKAIDYKEAVAFLDTTKVDLVLIDFKLAGKKTGIDVAHYINKNHKIPFVFLTSYTDDDSLHQIKETFPAGYICKPYNEVSLITTVEIALNNYLDTEIIVNIEIGKSNYRFLQRDVMYAVADHIYVELFLKEQTLLLRTSLTNLIEKLPEGTLKRINRSAAVNTRYIEKSNSKEITVNGVKFPVSKLF
jgi:DNA-binding LytR/AlgR family response regulator